MKLTIGKVIFNLRKEKGVTQHHLAEAIGVSVAAVSKWETGVSYPDITLLPALARYFDTSIDILMNYEATLSPEKILSIEKECARLFETDFEAGFKRCETLLKAYPNSSYLKFRLGYLYIMYMSKSSSEKTIEEMTQRAIKLMEDATLSDDLQIQHAAFFMLSTLYQMNEDYEKAIETLRKLPKSEINPDISLSQIYAKQGKLDQAIELSQKTLWSTLSQTITLINSLSDYSQKQNHFTKANEILNLEKQLIEAFSLEHLYMPTYYSSLLALYSSLKDESKTLECLEHYISYIESLESSSKQPMNHPLFSRLSFQHSSASKSHIKEMLLQSIELDTSLDFIRNSKTYKHLMSKLK